MNACPVYLNVNGVAAVVVAIKRKRPVNIAAKTMTRPIKVMSAQNQGRLATERRPAGAGTMACGTKFVSTRGCGA